MGDYAINPVRKDCKGCRCGIEPGIQTRHVGFERRLPPNYKSKSEILEREPLPVMDLKDFQSMAISNSEKKHAFTNFERYVNKQRLECQDITKMEQSLEQTAYKEKQIEDATNLARELEAIKKEEFKEAKLRQQLRTNSHELRDLERQLKSAYVNKELAAQIAQNEAAKLNEKKHAAKAYEIMSKAYITEKEHHRQLAQEEILKKAQYKKELQEQLILREKSKRYLYEEFLREKKLIDDIVQRIHDEDERERNEKMCKIKRTRDEILTIQKAQEEWKRKRSEEMEAENRKIEEYLMSKTSGELARLKEQQEKDTKKANIIEKIATQLVEDRERKKERDDIIQDLMEEELKEKMDKRHRDEVEKKLRIRLDTKLTLTGQMKETQDRLRQQQDEDRKYKEKMIAQMEEDAKLEQLSEQKRRMKRLQMRRDAEQLLAERRAKQAEEFQLMMGMEEEERRESELKKQIIEEERINLLKEHVQHLIGYLPKGLLRAEDLPHLSTDVVQHFQTSHATPFQPLVHRKR